LAKNKNHQDKVRDEAAAIFSEHDPRYEDMVHCRQIHAVIKESLRIYPPLIGLSRVAAEDCVVNGYHVPKETMFSLLTVATHKSPAFFDEPEIFKPERWLGTDENEAKLNQAWFPFGSGTKQNFSELSL